jgi:hypothetical protein
MVVLGKRRGAGVEGGRGGVGVRRVGRRGAGGCSGREAGGQVMVVGEKRGEG